jgi:hypothetical protein
MFEEKDLLEAGKRFAIVGPRVSEAEIDAIFASSFPGKEDLVQFYLRFNGGSRTPHGCICACRNPEHKAPRERLDTMTVEGFLSIPVDPNDRMLPFRPIPPHRARMLEIYSETPGMKKFHEQHVSFAFGHSGEDLCINLTSGAMWYMDYSDYKKGAIEISPTFRQFILQYWIGEEKGHPGHRSDGR